MKGWKTWLGVIGGIGTGVGVIVGGLLSDPIDPDKIWAGLLMISGALGLVGVGHKIEKNKIG